MSLPHNLSRNYHYFGTIFILLNGIEFQLLFFPTTILPLRNLEVEESSPKVPSRPGMTGHFY